MKAAKLLFIALSVGAHAVLFWLAPKRMPQSPVFVKPVRAVSIRIISVPAKGPAHPPAKGASSPRAVPKRPRKIEVATRHALSPKHEVATTHAATSSVKEGISRSDAQTPPSSTKGSVPADGAADPSMSEAYLSELRARIDQEKIYPQLARARHQTGRVEVGFVLGKSGELTQIHLASASPFHLLNDAAVAAVTATKQFRPIPAVLKRHEWAVVVPIVFTISE